ncbi:MAG: hypothetical protein ACREV4_06355, partial [Gammaproteobacteria bacterium]
YTLLLPLLVGLSGCLGPQIQPSTHSVTQIKTVLVVPIEAPPLEVTPDLLLTQQPNLAMLSETLPLDSVLERKVYRGPGGVLIAGWVNETPAANFNDGKAHWMPTMVLAQQIASRLLSNGTIKAIVSERYYKLPLANEARTAHLENWWYSIRQWYNQATASIDYSQFGADPVDAVFEVGVGGYCIWEEQVQLQVLMKLIDPHTKQVLGRKRSAAYPALGHAQALLSGDGENFKQFVTQTGTQLTADGLRYFRFLSE